MRNPRNETVAGERHYPSCRTCSGIHGAAKSTALEIVERWISEQVGDETKLHALSNRRQSEFYREVAPERILAFDQIFLPIAPPPLNLLFGCEGGFHRLGHFEPDEPLDIVSFSESIEHFVTVLDDSREKIRGCPSVKRAVESARQQVDARLSLPHAIDIAEAWMPEQVRHDG